MMPGKRNIALVITFVCAIGVGWLFYFGKDLRNYFYLREVERISNDDIVWSVGMLGVSVMEINGASKRVLHENPDQALLNRTVQLLKDPDKYRAANVVLYGLTQRTFSGGASTPRFMGMTVKHTGIPPNEFEFNPEERFRLAEDWSDWIVNQK